MQCEMGSERGRSCGLDINMTALMLSRKLLILQFLCTFHLADPLHVPYALLSLSDLAVLLHFPALPCTFLRSLAFSCISLALSCAPLRFPMLPRAFLCSFVLSCAPLCFPVLPCAFLRSLALSCAPSRFPTLSHAPCTLFCAFHACSPIPWAAFPCLAPGSPCPHCTTFFVFLALALVPGLLSYAFSI